MHKKSNKYSKDEVTLLWQPNKCTHSGVCIRGLSAVFNPTITPWIDMSKDETQSIVKQVQKCPSGALSILNN